MGKNKLLIGIFFAVDFIVVLYILIFGKNIQLFNPAGVISEGQGHIIIVLTTLMLFVALPMLFLMFYTAWKYRETNIKAKRENEDETYLAHFFWWMIPTLLVIIMAVVSWRATHVLDPYKPIASNIPPLTIQVVALDWKWLFIYPEQNVATVNYLQLPVNTPIKFVLTADAPMNSFWIPQLSGQIYAMSGMSTQIHVIGTKIGEYSGGGAEINGKGFAGMRFSVNVTSQENFDRWIASIKNKEKPLDKQTYENLAKPSENITKSFYSPVEENLYNSIISKFIMPTGTHEMMPGMKM